MTSHPRRMRRGESPWHGLQPAVQWAQAHVAEARRHRKAIVRTAGGRFRAVGREFRAVAAYKQLGLRLIPKATPLTDRNALTLSGIEIRLQWPVSNRPFRPPTSQ